MNETVFIAWGGNKELAEAVSELLRDKGYSVEVGGEIDPKSKEFYLGSSILQQLDLASRAVIMAQRSPRETRQAKSQDSTTEFRPNLMFEWGYLIARIRPPYHHVFLIGIRREELPSNLQGLRGATEIEIADNETMAMAIAGKFLADVTQVPVDPLRAFENWPEWITWIREQATEKEAPDNTRLAAGLIHTIQPAFYLGETQNFQSIVSEMRGARVSTSELQAARSLANAACEYYKLTFDPRRKPELADVKAIQEALLVPPTEDYDTCELTAWIEVIRNDFLGLCYRRMAESTEGDSSCRMYLERALNSFMKARESLNTLAVQANDPILKLWKGYVMRNLGRTHSELGQESDGQMELKEALIARQDSYATLRASNLEKSVLSQMLFEILLVELDLLKHGYAPPLNTLREVVASLKRSKPSIRPLSLWHRTLAQAKSVAESFGIRDVVQELSIIEHRYDEDLQLARESRNNDFARK